MADPRNSRLPRELSKPRGSTRPTADGVSLGRLRALPLAAAPTATRRAPAACEQWTSPPLAHVRKPQEVFEKGSKGTGRRRGLPAPPCPMPPFKPLTGPVPGGTGVPRAHDGADGPDWGDGQRGAARLGPAGRPPTPPRGCCGRPRGGSAGDARGPAASDLRRPQRPASSRRPRPPHSLSPRWSPDPQPPRRFGLSRQDPPSCPSALDPRLPDGGVRGPVPPPALRLPPPPRLSAPGSVIAPLRSPARPLTRVEPMSIITSSKAAVSSA